MATDSAMYAIAADMRSERDKLRADLAQARARLVLQEAVVEAVRPMNHSFQRGCFGGQAPVPEPEFDAWKALNRALQALDAAQAAGAETSCCAQHRPHMSYPTPPAGETHWVSVPWSWAVRPELQFPPDDDQAAGGDSEP